MKSGLSAVLLAAAMACAALPVQAQYAADRPIRMVVPSNAGSGQDAATRLLTEVLGRELKLSFVIENRVGANGMIGTDVIAKAAPDGYTIGASGSSALAAVQSLYKSVPYDPATSFAPVYLLAGAPSVLLVRSESPDKTLADLIARAKAAGNKPLTYGTGDATSIIAGQMLQNAAGIKLEEVRYKSSSDMNGDAVRGDLDIAFSSVPATRALMQQGRLRPLAVASLQRDPALPDTPTYAELGLQGIEAVNWVGVLAPAGTSPAQVRVLAEGIRQAIKDPELQKRYAAFGLNLFHDSGPEHFAGFIKTEVVKWGANLKAAGVQPE